MKKEVGPFTGFGYLILGVALLFTSVRGIYISSWAATVTAFIGGVLVARYAYQHRWFEPKDEADVESFEDWDDEEEEDE